ncbi:MAG: PAS domain-containing protein [Anaerolineae bacterium]|nr:PAS domain-containing protein [Anaerolineae bacterium]
MTEKASTPDVPPYPDRTEAVLACLRGETTCEAVALSLGVSPDEVRQWQAAFIAGGTNTLNGTQAHIADLESQVASAHQLAKQMAALNAVSQSLSAILELDQLLDTTLDTLYLVFGYSTCIGLIEGAELVMKGGYTLTGEKLDYRHTRLPIAIEAGRRVISRAAALGRPLYIPDTNREPDYIQDREVGVVRSEVAIPILFKGNLHGVMAARSGAPRAFDQNDHTLLETVAFQLAIAIENAWLFQQTQAQLREISLFRRLTDEAIVAIITRSKDGVIGYANRAAAALFQYPDAGAMRNESVRALYPDDGWYEIDQQICDHAASYGGWNGEVTQQRRNGQTVITDLSVFPIHAPDGAFITFGMILQDATERHRLLDAIQRSNARFEAILEAADDGIIVWDEAWRVLLVNPAASRLLNTPPEQLIGLTHDQWSAQPHLMALANARENEQVELPGRERHVVRCRHLRWQSDGASGPMTLIYDVTSQVALEQAREEMASMLIHDLRGPLTSVVGGIEMAQAMLDENKPDRTEHFLNMAARNGSLLLTMANSLLDIARFESGRMILDLAPLQVDVLLDEAIDILSNTAHGAGIVLTAAAGTDLPTVMADATMIRRALVNLVDNALKFTPRGGDVRVFAERANDQTICFGVADTGPGIPEAFRQKIFDKYVQVPGTTNRRQGTGLGLAFCRLVAQAHHGQIWVEPRPTGGSVFCFTITNSAG